jgi:hypothetical protein
MPASESQRRAYRDKFRSLFNEAFQAWFEELASAFHPAGDFQPIRKTSGDGGLDGLVINSQVVYQVYAPARIRELHDSKTATKIKSDFQTALATLSGRMRTWILVHNHPEAKIGKKTAAALSELSAHHPNITVGALDIDSLWQKLAELPDEAVRRLFPSESSRELHVDHHQLSTQLLAKLVAINRTFPVPALEVHLPIEKVWDRLKWEDEGTVSGASSTSLEDAVRHYYEWARLADTSDTSGNFPATVLLKSGSKTVILGGPGAGKSTLARKLVWQVASSGRSVWHCSLRAVAKHMERGLSFVEALHASAMQQAGAPGEFWSHTVRPDVLIADGLDEAEPNRLHVAEALRSWLVDHAVTVVVMTRPVGHSPGILPEFRTAELVPLTEAAARELAQYMLETIKASAQKAEEFVEQISAQGLVPLRNATKLARRNPLLLSFLVALHRDGQPLSGNRPALYASILQLLERSSVGDRIVGNRIRGPFLHRAVDALAWVMLSHPGMDRDTSSVAIGQALQTEVLPQNLREQVDVAIDFWVERRLLEMLRVRHRESVAFVHPTLGEYCAARYLARVDDSSLDAWLNQQSRASTSREIILLACGGGAVNRIIPKLLKLDIDEVLSREAVLAAACLAETENADSDLAATVARHLAARLESPVPLVSVEAADALYSIVSASASLLHDICLPLLQHSQPWTRLGARTLSLASGAAVPASEVATWFNSRGATRSSWRHWPSAAFNLEKRLLELGFVKLFTELSREEARDVAVRFYKENAVSFGEAEVLEKVLRRFGSEDLLKDLRVGWKEHTAFLRSFDPASAVERNERALLEIILAATGQPRDNVKTSADFVPSELSVLLSCIHFWDAGLSTFWSLERRERDPAAIEVMRGAIVAANLSPLSLASEINVLLARDNLRNCLSEFVRPREMKAVDWKRSITAKLDGEKLADACLHPSEIVVVTATNLLGAGAAGEVAAQALRKAFVQCDGSTLYYVCRLAGVIWKDEAVAVLCSRLLYPAKDGLQYVFRALGEHATEGQKSAVQEMLLTVLLSDEAELAAGAAEGLAQLNPANDAPYVERLEEALRRWSSRKIQCRKCNVAAVQGSCPKCHVIPLTPRAEIVRNLSATGAMSTDRLLKLAEDEWSAVRDVAIEQLMSRARGDIALGREILMFFGKGGGSIALLSKLLALGNETLTPLVSELLALSQSKNHEVRIAFLEAACSLPISRDRMLQIAREAIGDSHFAVRDAATRLLRNLCSP